MLVITTLGIREPGQEVRTNLTIRIQTFDSGRNVESSWKHENPRQAAHKASTQLHEEFPADVNQFRASRGGVSGRASRGLDPAIQK